MARQSLAEDLLDVVKGICFHLPLWAVPIIATIVAIGADILLSFLAVPFASLGIQIPPILYLVVVGGSFLLSLLAGYAGWKQRSYRKNLVGETNSIEKLKRLSWFQFELLIAEYYRKEGYNVAESGGSKPDGGIDLVATSSFGQRTLIQCKHWNSSNVGVKVVREVLGILAKEQASKAVIFATGNYTKEAIKFAEGQPVELIDGAALLKMVNLRDIPTATSEPDQPRPYSRMTTATNEQCPRCGSTLVQRIAQRGINKGNTFLGCSSFPKCRFTQNANRAGSKTRPVDRVDHMNTPTM